MKYTKKLLFIVVMLSALVVSVMSVQSASALPVTLPVPQPLNWQPCADAPDKDCATLTVPLDYNDLTKGTIALPVARAKAADTAQRIGPLFFNLGGPGVPSTGTVKSGDLTRTFSAEIRSKFDIVGFDPRGTTTDINCFATDAQSRQYWEANHLPKTLGEVQHIAGLNQQMNQTCLSQNTPLVRHVDTASTVRDMEQLRRAMAIDKFSFIGFSYGTFIGHRYAKLYPGHLRAMVLDAATDRSVNDLQSFTENTLAFEHAWKQFKQWCHARSSCVLQNQDIDAIFSQLLAQARANPIPAPYNPYGNRPVNDWQLTIAVQASITPGSATFAWTDEIINKARNGDASLASLLYDSGTGYNPATNSYGSGGTRRSIFCIDTTWSQKLGSPLEVKALSSVMEAISPHFGKGNVYQGPAQCYKYPVAPVEAPPVALSTNPGAPTLVVGATNDTSTPYIWSVRTAVNLQGSRLLTRQGDGHISLGKSRCVEAAVNSALVQLTLPAHGKVCQTDEDLYPPSSPPILGPSAQQFNSATNAAQNLQRLLKNDKVSW